MNKNERKLEKLLFNELDSVVDQLFPQVPKLNSLFSKTRDKFHFFKKHSSNHQNLVDLQYFLQYHAIKITIANICNNLTFIQNTKENFTNLFGNKIHLTQLVTKFKSITLEPVLTCHPTEPFSHSALKTIDTIHLHLEKHYPTYDSNVIRKLLIRLMEIPLVPLGKSSVEVEVMGNLVYFHKIYSILPSLKEIILSSGASRLTPKQQQTIKQHFPNLLKPRSWAGGDADGNVKVTAETMIHALQIQSRAVLNWHQNELKKILSISKLPNLICNHLKQWQPLLESASRSVRRLEHNYLNFLKEFNQFIVRHSKYIKSNPLLATKLENFQLQLATFKFNLAPIDVRQNAKVYQEVYAQLSKAFKKPITYQVLLKNSEVRKQVYTNFKENLFLKNYPIVHQELKRIKVIASFPSFFQNLIISNTSTKEDILLPFALCKVFHADPNLIPLFETNHALNKALSVIQGILANRTYKESLKGKLCKVMIGYSDSERESGIFILPHLEQVANNLKSYFHSKKIKYSIFHGNGLDLARGGPTIYATEQTIQGNHKRYILSTPYNSLFYFLRTIKAAIDEKDISNTSQIKKLALKSVAEFENLFLKKRSRQELEKYLQIASPFWLFVKTNNFSSRSTRRDESEEFNPFKPWLKENYFPDGEILNGIRAISQVNAIEGTFTNFNLWYGLYEFLVNLKKAKSPTSLKGSYVTNDILNKALIGLRLSDFSAAKNYIPKNEKVRFLTKIQSSMQNTSKLISTLKIALPTNIKSEIDIKKNLFTALKYFMCFANTCLIYRSSKTQPKPLKSIFKANIDEDAYLELISKIFGATYCGYTEYRTPPYSLLDISFQLLLQSKNLDTRKNKS